MKKENGQRKFTLLLVLAMTIWGFSWSSGKVISSYTDRETIVFWRFVLTFISYVPIALFSGESLTVNKKGFMVILGGSIFYTVYSVLFFLGLEHGMAGHGGVLVTTLNPIITFLIVMIFSFHVPAVSQTIGLILGLTGGAILLEVWKPEFLDHIFLSGNIYFLMASGSWAMVSIMARLAVKYSSSSAYSLYVYGISTFFIFLFTDPTKLGYVFSMDSFFWMNMFYLSLVSTTFGTTMYFHASAKLGSAKASSYIFLVPFTALLGSWFFLKENPTWTIIAGGFFAVLAVYFINGSIRLIIPKNRTDNE